MPLFTYDLATNVGKVRMLIADTDATAHDFADEEVEAALEQEGDSLKRGAALLLLVLASNRARLAVSVKRGAVSEDLTKVAVELRASAAVLVGQAAAEEDVPLSAIISPSYETFSYTVNLHNDRENEVNEAP